MEDRRKHQRFKLRDSCIINHSEVVGTVIDISMGGLSCACLSQDRCQNECIEEVDIYCRKEGLWAKGLSIRVLGSELVPGKFSEEYSVRKCRLQFVQLEDGQSGQVENIIIGSSLPER